MIDVAGETAAHDRKPREWQSRRNSDGAFASILVFIRKKSECKILARFSHFFFLTLPSLSQHDFVLKFPTVAIQRKSIYSLSKFVMYKHNGTTRENQSIMDSFRSIFFGAVTFRWLVSDWTRSASARPFAWPPYSTCPSRTCNKNGHYCLSSAKFFRKRKSELVRIAKAQNL